MEKLLWTFEQVAQFSRHPDLPVRRWAVERLVKRFRHQAGSVLLEALDDDDWLVASLAARFLGNTGDRGRYGPELMERLRRPGYSAIDAVAIALSRLDHREALPLILERIARRDLRTDSNDHFAILNCLVLYSTFIKLLQVLHNFAQSIYVYGIKVYTTRLLFLIFEDNPGGISMVCFN